MEEVVLPDLCKSGLQKQHIVHLLVRIGLFESVEVGMAFVGIFAE